MQKATANLIKELKKQKRQGDLLFLDNAKIIKDALSQGSIKAKYILVNSANQSQWPQPETLLVDNTTIEMLSDSKTPQGVVCIADYPQYTVQKPSGNFLVLDRLQDPGNVGTLIRSAYASGFEYVFLLDSVRPTNPKLVRSSAGALFLTKVIPMQTAEFVKLAKQWKVSLLKADMQGKNVFDFTPKGTVGVVVGNEGQGVGNEIGSLCTQSVKIPMQKGIESLNAGVSGSIIMYQIALKTKFFK